MGAWPITAIGISALNTALFMSQNALVAPISTPADGGNVTGLPWSVVWSFSPGTQSDFRYVVYANDGITVLYDTGVVSSSSKVSSIPITVPLVNGTTYKHRVSGHTTIGAVFSSALQSFVVSWTPPATITGLTLTKHGEQS